MNENNQNLLEVEKPRVSKISRRVIGIIIAVVGAMTLLTLTLTNSKPKTKDNKQDVVQPQVRSDNIPFADYGIKPVNTDNLKNEIVNELEKKIRSDKIYITDKEAQSLFQTLNEVNKRLSQIEKKDSENYINNYVKQFPSQEEEERIKDEAKAKRSDVLFQTPSANISIAPHSSKALTDLQQAQEAAELLKKSGFQPNQFPGGTAAQGDIRPDDTALQGMQYEKRGFVDLSGQQDRSDYLSGKLKSPVSPYEVKAGGVIPCTLITGLNSDLPGPIIAQVRENVWDTVNGKYLLIPQGTRIVGEYDSVVAYGQERLLIIFNRLIMPNGNSIGLEGMPGLDLSGYAGLKDRVNHHWIRLISGVILSSLISASANYATSRSDNLESYLTALAESSGRVGERIAEKNLNIQPTIQVRPGWNFNVFVHKDMILKPYQI